MSFSFAIALTTARDRVRVRIGDTDSNDVLLDNETIDYILTAQGNNETRAAYESCKLALAKLHARTDRTAVGMTTARSQRFEQMETILKMLEHDLTMTSGGIGVFGLTTTDVGDVEDDDNFILPFAHTGRDRYE